MRQSSSPSTPPSSASRSPYASFFDLQNMLMCGCTSDVEALAPSEEAVSPQYCRHNDDAFFPEHVLDEDNSIADVEDEYENPSDIAKVFLDKITQQIAEIDTKKRPQPWKRSRSVPTKIGDIEKSEDRVFREADAPTSRDDSQFPSIKHTASESTQSTTSLSFDEDEEEHEDEQEGPFKPTSILRRKAKLAEVTIEASGAGVRFDPSTVFLERSSGKRKPLRRKPRIQVQVQTYTEDELRRIARRSKQNQYSRHELQFSPYLTNDIRSPSSDLLFQTESFYVFR